MVEYDSFKEVINGNNTYKCIAKYLIKGQSVLVGWGDNKFTHLDILFTANLVAMGNFQRGIKGNELFVSIIGYSCFGFDINNVYKDKGYISEKLQITGNPTIEKLGELINNIIKEIVKYKNEVKNNG